MSTELRFQFEAMQFMFFFCVFFVLNVVGRALTIPGVPDTRDLHVQISRGSGTGVISFGYALVVLMALVLFIFLMGVIICYKRDKGIRNEEKTIFLTRF